MPPCSRDTHSWSPELPFKKPGNSQATVLEGPERGHMERPGDLKGGEAPGEHQPLGCPAQAANMREDASRPESSAKAPGCGGAGTSRPHRAMSK